jgi:hypothetical protein
MSSRRGTVMHGNAAIITIIAAIPSLRGFPRCKYAERARQWRRWPHRADAAHHCVPR